MSKNIYNKREIICPACKTGFELMYPNPKLYAPTSRDEDERVTGYSWVMGIQTNVLPHYYSVLQCPNCLFADFRERLEKPGYGSKERILFQFFSDLKPERLMLLQNLRQIVQREKINLDAALALHLAAIFITLLPGHEMSIDQLKLGRLYLRLSWLYKEQQMDALPVESKQENNKNGAGSTVTSKLITNIEELEEKIQAALDLLENTRQLAVERTQELDLPLPSNPFARFINTAEADIERALQTLSQLEHVVMQDKNRILVLKEKPSPLQIIDFTATETDVQIIPPTLEELIPSLVAQWPHFPRTEMTATQLAMEAFEKSFTSEEVNQSIHQSMIVGNIILQLLQKLGDSDRALKYSVQLYKSGYKDRQSLQMSLNQGQRDQSLNETELKEINRMITIVTNTMSKAADSRKKLVAEIFARDKEKINQIMAPLADASPQDQIQALLNAGIAEELIAWLKDRQVVSTDTKKKKWFGK